MSMVNKDLYICKWWSRFVLFLQKSYQFWFMSIDHNFPRMKYKSTCYARVVGQNLLDNLDHQHETYSIINTLLVIFLAHLTNSSQTLSLLHRPTVIVNVVPRISWCGPQRHILVWFRQIALYMPKSVNSFTLFSVITYIKNKMRYKHYIHLSKWTHLHQKTSSLNKHNFNAHGSMIANILPKMLLTKINK